MIFTSQILLHLCGYHLMYILYFGLQSNENLKYRGKFSLGAIPFFKAETIGGMALEDHKFCTLYCMNLIYGSEDVLSMCSNKKGLGINIL